MATAATDGSILTWLLRHESEWFFSSLDPWTVSWFSGEKKYKMHAGRPFVEEIDEARLIHHHPTVHPLLL